MRYSLCSRFRGTLLGAAVGDVLSQAIDISPVVPEFDKSSTVKDFSWEQVAVAVAQGLIEKQTVDLSKVNSYFPEQAKIINPVKVTIAALPIALFYHDNETQLRSNLQQFLAWQQDPEIVAGVLAVGYAIALSLTEKLQAASLIPQILHFIADPQLLLHQQLMLVKSLLKHQVSIVKAVSVLGEQPSSAIALAFYSFLSSLEDFSVCVKRAATYNLSISSLTGALSGAYNTPCNIPVNWRLLLSCSARNPLAAWGVHNEAEILHLCDSLFAVWSGVYHVTSTADVMAIAAPQVIRLR